MATTTPAIPTRTNGQTIDQTWFNTLKSVDENQEGRLQSLENEIQRFMFTCNSKLDHQLDGTSHLIIPVLRNITLLDAQVIVFVAGSSGVLEVDFKYMRPSVSLSTWTSVLSTRPSRNKVAGTGKSTNGVINPLYDDIDSGDYLRLDITNMQVGLRQWACYLAWQRRG